MTRRWVRICRFFGPTAVLLLALEVVFRFCDSGSGLPLVPDPVLNHVWIPHSSFLHTEWSGRGIPPYTHSYNGQSWISDHEISLQPREGVPRIFYVGDSFIEGTCPVSDSVPSIIASGLSKKRGGEVEVINTGTSSYAPTLYYLLIKTKLLSYKPDLIVVNVDMTDVFDDSLYRATLKLDETGDPVACPPGHPLLGRSRRTANGLEKLSYYQEVAQFALTRSAFLGALGRKVQAVMHPVDVHSSSVVPPSFGWCSESRSDEVNESVRWSLEMLRRTIRFCRVHGVKIALTAVPHEPQLEGKWSVRPMGELAELCASEGVPFFDPTAEFRNRCNGKFPCDLYIPGDMHFNPAGYRAWAELQLNFVSTLLDGV